MANPSHQFSPDYAVAPGRILEERLGARNLSHAEFARRCGRSAKLISEIIAGKAPVEPETALQFEKVLGVDASIWIGVEAKYRLHQAKLAEEADVAGSLAWLRSFPLPELVKRGAIGQPESDSDAFSKLLSFFGVGSVEAWHLKHDREKVVYRHSPAFDSDEAALATWLRLGEIDADGQECAEYAKPGFKRALGGIRGLTREPIEGALARARRLCNESGVALTMVEPLPKVALSGAAWWLAPGKAVIQLSGRHKTDDHLWFSFFHEAAHILLHSKKGVFVDGKGRGDDDIEAEANEFAEMLLIPRPAWNRYLQSFQFTEGGIRAFADEQGIAPGIVVGMLQHERKLPWRTGLNDLKERYEWQ